MNWNWRAQVITQAFQYPVGFFLNYFSLCKLLWWCIIVFGCCLAVVGITVVGFRIYKMFSAGVKNIAVFAEAFLFPLLYNNTQSRFHIYKYIDTNSLWNCNISFILGFSSIKKAIGPSTSSSLISVHKNHLSSVFVFNQPT